jgi:hypothetical protein
MPSSKAIAAGLVLVAALPLRALQSQTRADPPVIDTIIVVARDIFDPNEMVETPPLVMRIADALHVRTRTAVIRRALTVNQGDAFDPLRVAESARALRNLGVFREVGVDTIRVRGRLALLVETADGWSTKPQFNFSSSGGSITWAAGIEEDNLLGTATSLRALYTKTPDRSLGQFVYSNPHFLGRRTRMSASYAALSDGDLASWAVGLPFYETAARHSYGTTGDVGTVRVLEFENGVFRDSVRREILRFNVNGGVALHATSSAYVRLWGIAIWRREQFGPRKYVVPMPSDSIVVLPDSISGTVGLGIEYGRPHYQVLRHFNTYARREDVNVSQFLRVGLWAAPQAFGYPAGKAGVGVEFGGGASGSWPGGFVQVRVRTNGVFTGSDVDSARVRGGVTIASQNIADQTIIVHLEGGALRRPRPGAEYDPWEDQTGPRLFPAHAVTGDRTVWFAFEDRILVAEEAWGLVGVGLAPYFDWGGAWYDGKEMRVGGNVGVSARLGPTRAVRGEVTEFAFGYRFGVDIGGVPIDGWAFTLRRGIVF